LAKRHKKALKQPSENFTDFPKLPTFDPLQLVITPHKVLNRLPISFSKLDAIIPNRMFHPFLTDFIIGKVRANRNSDPQQQLRGPEREQQRFWHPGTAQDLYLRQAIHSHMGFIGVPAERDWMKDGVYLPKEGLRPTAYLGKTRFWEICPFFHVSPFNSPTETHTGLP